MANDELKAKTEAVTELEGQVESLKSSLEVLQAEMETKGSQATETESSKAALETTLQETKDELAKLQAEYEELKSTVEASKEEVRFCSDIDFSHNLRCRIAWSCQGCSHIIQRSRREAQ